MVLGWRWRCAAERHRSYVRVGCTPCTRPRRAAAVEEVLKVVVYVIMGLFVLLWLSVDG